MKTLELNQMEIVEGGFTTGDALCAGGIGLVIVSAGVDIFAFAEGVVLISEYCGASNWVLSIIKVGSNFWAHH